MSKRDANDVLRDEGPDTLRALYDEAIADGSYQSQICADEMADKGTEPHEDDLRPPAFSDEALALRFAERHETDLRYVAAWGQWLRYDGRRWVFDHTLFAFDCARRICRAAAAKCNESSTASIVASAKTVAAVERLARADRRLASTVEQWDTDPWLLNTPEAVIDLRTGVFRGHRPDDHLTRVTAVSPGGTCPIWRNFLARITDRDTEIEAFLQRACGYALTGSTREQSLFFLQVRTESPSF